MGRVHHVQCPALQYFDLQMCRCFIANHKDETITTNMRTLDLSCSRSLYFTSRHSQKHYFLDNTCKRKDFKGQMRANITYRVTDYTSCLSNSSTNKYQQQEPRVKSIHISRKGIQPLFYSPVIQPYSLDSTCKKRISKDRCEHT